MWQITKKENQEARNQSGCGLLDFMPGGDL